MIVVTYTNICLALFSDLGQFYLVTVTINKSQLKINWSAPEPTSRVPAYTHERSHSARTTQPLATSGENLRFIVRMFSSYLTSQEPLT